MKNHFWNNTLIYGLGFLSIRAISFLLLPLHTNILSPSVVGFIFLLMTLLAFLNTIYHHGMDASLLKFFHNNKPRAALSTSILYSMIAGIPLSLIVLACNNTLGNAFISTLPNMLFAGCIALILFCDMIASRLLNILRLTDRPYYYLFVCLGNVFISLFLNIIFIKNLMLGFDGALFALVGTALAQLILLVPIMFNNVKISLFNVVLLKNMLKFSLPVLPAAVFLVAVELSDRWMLKWLDGVVSVGLYGAGYKIGSLMLIVVKSFNLNWQPYYLKFQKNYANGKFDLIGTSFILILIFMWTMISIAFPYIIKFSLNSYTLMGKEFWPGIQIVPYIALSYLLYGVFVLQMPSIYLKNKQNWMPLLWGAGLFVNFFGNLILIPSYSYFGAAIATLLSYATMLCLLVYKNRTWLPIYYRAWPIFCFSGASILLLVINQFFSLSIIIFLLIFIYVVFTFNLIKKTFIYPK